MNIGLLIIATGKYKVFLKDLISSGDIYFFKNEEDKVKYFLFVDEPVDIDTNRETIQTIIEHKPWPFPTLFRYKNFMLIKEELENLDYIYYVDSDMKFENFVDKEILGDIVCTEHPWFPDSGAGIGKRGTPENNPKSLAYIPDDFDFKYMQNCFFGGSKSCVLNMFRFLANQIDIDYKRGIIAKWHDESHANKFYALYATKILNSEYSYSHGSHACKNGTLVPRIVTINKNNNFLRN